MTILLSIIIFFGERLTHPTHLSVCDIEYNLEANLLQVSQRFFLDDFEETLNYVYNKKVDLINPTNKNLQDSLIQEYILSHLIISINEKKNKHKFIGYEIEKDVLWSYIEYYGVKKIKYLSVTNTSFFELYEDQNTLISVNYMGSTFNKRVSQAKPTEKFVFN